MEPLSQVKEGQLSRYRIGRYPPQRTIKTVDYKNPRGFVRVTKENSNILLTPHFTLGQFLCKQDSDYPKFIVLQENLLLLLENVLSEVRRSGFNIDTLGFISGYRTPYYNRKIKNVQYSRHVYGDAADIFIDVDKDGRMDDLNGDGLTLAKNSPGREPSNAGC